MVFIPPRSWRGEGRAPTAKEHRRICNGFSYKYLFPRVALAGIVHARARNPAMINGFTLHSVLQLGEVGSDAVAERQATSGPWRRSARCPLGSASFYAQRHKGSSA
jgi:hypothetical protein